MKTTEEQRLELRKSYTNYLSLMRDKQRQFTNCI